MSFSGSSDPLRAASSSFPYYGLPVLEYLSLASPPTGDKRGPLLDRQKALELEILSLKAVLNAGVPINSLPPELLVEVALFIQSDPRYEYEWVSILQVCRRWHAVLSLAPRLWCNLVARGSLRFLHTGLARSKALTVYVKFTKPESPDSIAQFASVITPHILRVRKLDCASVPRHLEPALAVLLQSAMPTLEFLRISLTQTMDAHSAAAKPLVTLSSELFPRLRGVSLNGVAIHPSSPVIPHLRTFSLRGVGTDSLMSLAALRTTLQSCRNVENLTISDFSVRSDPDLYLPPHPSHELHFPQLRSLNLSNYTTTLEYLLRILNAPLDARVTITRQFGQNQPVLDWMRAGVRCVLPEDRKTLPLLAHCTHARATVTPSEQSYHGHAESGGNADSPKGSLSLAMGAGGLRVLRHAMRSRIVPVLKDFIQVFQGAPLCDLSVDIDPEYLSKAGWREVFAAFPQLHTISIQGGGKLDRRNLKSDVHLVLEALDPEHDPDRAGRRVRVVCRDLACLRLAGFAVNEDFLLVVETCLMNRKAMLGREKALAVLDCSVRVTWGNDLDSLEDRRGRWVGLLTKLVSTVVYDEV